MKKLIALAAAIGAVVFFWKKKGQHEEDTWSTASDTASGWGDSAASTASDAADAAESAVEDATS
jgi:hypothetical protein